MLPDFGLKTYAEAVDARLNALLPPESKPPERLHEAMRHACLAPGKRIRPALCMASAEAVGAASGDVIDAACAIEMAHCFSLIHDDLPCIDDDLVRRGRPTVHVLFGEGLAVMAGDALFALAFDTLARSPGNPASILAAVQELTRACGSEGMVGGEVLDILSERQTPTLDLVQHIHELKSGALIAASCAIGAILGGATQAQIGTLGAYGRRVGLAFQIADDVLNATASTRQLGKAGGSDAARGKATYVAAVGVEAARLEAQKLSRQAAEALEGLPSDTAMLRYLATFSGERSI